MNNFPQGETIKELRHDHDHFALLVRFQVGEGLRNLLDWLRFGFKKGTQVFTDGEDEIRDSEGFVHAGCSQAFHNVEELGGQLWVFLDFSVHARHICINLRRAPIKLFHCLRPMQLFNEITDILVVFEILGCSEEIGLVED